MAEGSGPSLAQRLESGIFVFNMAQTFIWACLIAPTVLLWKHSLLWIALMSVWANFAAALAAAVASWIQRQNRKREEDG